MTTEEIGINAGIVWNIINECKYCRISMIKRKSKLSDIKLGAALGWLARENKIAFDTSQGDDCVYLVN